MRDKPLSCLHHFDFLLGNDRRLMVFPETFVTYPIEIRFDNYNQLYTVNQKQPNARSPVKPSDYIAELSPEVSEWLEERGVRYSFDVRLVRTELILDMPNPFTASPPKIRYDYIYHIVLGFFDRASAIEFKLRWL